MIIAPRFSLLLTALLTSTGVDALWPQPRNIQTGSNALVLSQDFQIKVSGSASAELAAAVSRTEGYLSTDKLGRLVVGRGSSDADALEGAAQLHTLTLQITSGAIADISVEARLPFESRDEAYNLTVPADGSEAQLTATSTLGLFRGLATFSQLWYTYNQTTYALDLPLSIEDSPAYVSYYLCPASQIINILTALPWIHVRHSSKLLPH